MKWSLSLISSWALDAEGRVRQGCYRSTPSGEEAKGAEEERREVTGRVFSTPLVLKGRTPQSSHLPWAGVGGGRGGWQGRPFLSKTLLGTMADIAMASATSYTLYSPSPQP